MLCLGMVSTNLFRLFYAGEIQNLNCRRLEMATYSGIYFFTRGCTQTPTYVEVLPSFAHCRWMNTNTALRKYASPARIRYSNKVLYTMFRTAHRLCSDVFFLFVGCQTFTNFKLASLWMRGAQERALLVPDDNIVIYSSCTIIKMKTTVVVVVLDKYRLVYNSIFL